MSEDLTAIAKQIGVLHEKPSDDFMGIVNATRKRLELDPKPETRIPTSDRRVEQPRNKHIGRKVIAATVTLAALFGAEQAVEKGLDVLRHDDAVVENYQVSLENGDTVVNMVSKALDDIAVSKNIDRGELNGTSAAQNAATEMMTATGEKYNQPGETYKIDIFKNDLGDEQVYVEPVIETAP